MSEIAKGTTSHENYPQSNHRHATPFAIQTHSSLILVLMQDIRQSMTIMPPQSSRRRKEEGIVCTDLVGQSSFLTVR